MGTVCKSFNCVCGSDRLWKPIYEALDITAPRNHDQLDHQSTFIKLFQEWRKSQLSPWENQRKSVLQSPPQFLDYMSPTKTRVYVITFVLLLIYERCLTPFLFISYALFHEEHPDESLYNVGMSDLCILWSVLLMGPFICNIFQVWVLKPILIRYLHHESLSVDLRTRFFRSGWIFSALIFLNIWAICSMSKEEWMCAWFPWLHNTWEWWENSPGLTFGQKWFYIISLANDGFAVGMTFTSSSNIRSPEMITLTLCPHKNTGSL
eukprot:TRINITY_DN4279_c0_g1_i1.p1 TRINITY_DN4279_c0_g1~~TRINITY_DN4279_c0_g1_i1.p1  ORF type:complete len:293 (+),score=38.88 TRINITY_DN4279_c0_g1_i1:89-880(+)